MERKQRDRILRDLEKKIVFLVGPRQVGKTWLARDIGREFTRPAYLNWDSLTDRRVIRREGWPVSTDLLILDELHKMKGWKGFLKGVFDTRPAGTRILVTGSAGLDILRRGGPSLAGRFFTHRLMPFSPSEVSGTRHEGDLGRFLSRGGFPEPFLADTEQDADRWRAQYLDGLIREDVLDIERIHDLRALQLIVELLRSRVGSPVSYQSLSEDVGVAPNTVRKYVGLLEALFVVFRVTPWSDNVARSLVKNPKLYLFDGGLVRGDDGARFENLVAVCLLKHVLAEADRTGRDHRLCSIRTKDGREVDFCVVADGRPAMLVEATWADKDVAPALPRFARALGVPAVQVVKELRRDERFGDVEVRRAAPFLEALGP